MHLQNHNIEESGFEGKGRQVESENQGSRATAAKVDIRIRVRGQGPLGVENDIRVRGEELSGQGGNSDTLQSWSKNTILA